MIKNDVLSKFLDYVKFDTASSEQSNTFPSTNKQTTLLKYLYNQLLQLGLQAEIDEYSYVTATLKSNTDKNSPVLAFIAHVDTAPVVSGTDVKAKVVTYQGGDILLNEDSNFYLKEDGNSYLKELVGSDIVVTDGTTLLGADDKAGVAEIMSAIEHLVKNPSIEHGEIKVVFTPDEEVGRGVDYFNVEKLSADYGYTIDGGELGEIEYENFNACGVDVVITGVSIHPGYAKDVMVNAIDVFTKFHQMLPPQEVPEKTSGYEGFYMINNATCDVEKTTAHYIIRQFDEQKFSEAKLKIQEIANKLNKIYGDNTVKVKITDSYFNMKPIIEKHFHLIENAKLAMQAEHIQAKVVPIRGGTDGCRLSFMGLPCPNLSTGGMNFHSRTEYIPVESLQKMKDVILKLISIYSTVEKESLV